MQTSKSMRKFCVDFNKCKPSYWARYESINVEAARSAFAEHDRINCKRYLRRFVDWFLEFKCKVRLNHNEIEVIVENMYMHLVQEKNASKQCQNG